MTFSIYPWYPVTRQYVDTGQTSIGLRAIRTDSGEFIIEYPDDTSTGWYPSRLIVDTPNRVEFVDDNGFRIVLRPSEEDDVAASPQWQKIGFPVPVEVIGAMMAGRTEDPVLYAGVSPSGEVQTMLMETDQGFYARYSGLWMKVPDGGMLSHLTLEPILDGAQLDMYDEADQAGRILAASAFAFDQRPRQTRTEPIAASAMVMTPIIATLEDLDTAIDNAVKNPTARFYVERRARALGYTEGFPWDGE